MTKMATLATLATMATLWQPFGNPMATLATFLTKSVITEACVKREMATFGEWLMLFKTPLQVATVSRARARISRVR